MHQDHTSSSKITNSKGSVTEESSRNNNMRIRVGSDAPHGDMETLSNDGQAGLLDRLDTDSPLTHLDGKKSNSPTVHNDDKSDGYIPGMYSASNSDSSAIQFAADKEYLAEISPLVVSVIESNQERQW